MVDQLAELSAVLTYKTYKDHINAANMAKTISNKIEILQAEVNPHYDALTSLHQNGVPKINTDQIDKLVKLKEHQKVLYKLLTDKNSFIRKSLISKTLPFLNQRIAVYTKMMHLPHSVTFQADLTCEITRRGLPYGHGNLSNGEKKRLNLGISFAFRDALSYLHTKVNLLLTDEIDGGSLDEQSIMAMIEVLKLKSREDKIGIYIISHRPEFEGRCGRNIIVRKELGFSSLIYS